VRVKSLVYRLANSAMSAGYAGWPGNRTSSAEVMRFVS
jgi:hypothetical protein